MFALYGIFGFVGIAIATRIVDSWGAYKTSLLFTSVLLTGVTGWALSAGSYALMAGSVAVWGLGFASTNSMQQVRLVTAAPTLASASVSLNTSVLYIGQAVGSAIGGMLFARDLLYGAGYVAAGFVALARDDGGPDQAPAGRGIPGLATVHGAGSRRRDFLPRMLFCPRESRSESSRPARLKVGFALHRQAQTKLEVGSDMKRIVALVLVLYSGAAMAQGTAAAPAAAPATGSAPAAKKGPPTVGGKPLVQVKPRGPAPSSEPSARLPSGCRLALKSTMERKAAWIASMRSFRPSQIPRRLLRKVSRIAVSPRKKTSG